MAIDQLSIYDHIRNGHPGFYKQKRGLIAVWGKEAVQFLDGLISNDMKTLEDGGQMLAAFPNAQGRLLAVVGVYRWGDRFLLETEDAARDKLYQNLFRFTFAGDFYTEDLSANYQYFEVYGKGPGELPELSDTIEFRSASVLRVFVPNGSTDAFESDFVSKGAVSIPDELYETLRIENGIPKYDVDMDETTIVPELGIEGLISYTKGCYIGQEIIARIHFRGHVAKQLTGLILSGTETGSTDVAGAELTTPEGKNAGKITSVTFSPKLNANIALGYVRYDYLSEGTELVLGDRTARVTKLPFVK